MKQTGDLALHTTLARCGAAGNALSRSGACDRGAAERRSARAFHAGRRRGGPAALTAGALLHATGSRDVDGRATKTLSSMPEGHANVQRRSVASLVGACSSEDGCEMQSQQSGMVPCDQTGHLPERPEELIPESSVSGGTA
jgi:hypothetical protein